MVNSEHLAGLRESLVDLRCARMLIDPENKKRFDNICTSMLSVVLEDPLCLPEIAGKHGVLTEHLEQELLREMAYIKRQSGDSQRQQQSKYEAVATEILRGLEAYVCTLSPGEPQPPGVTEKVLPILKWEDVVRCLKIHRELFLAPLTSLRSRQREQVIRLIAQSCATVATWDWECEQGKLQDKEAVVDELCNEFVERIRKKLEKPYKF